VSNECAIQCYARDVANITNAKDWIIAEIDLCRDFDPPNRCLVKVGTERSSRNRLVNFPYRNFAKRPCCLQAFEMGLVGDNSRTGRSETLENAIGLSCDTPFFAIEKGWGWINGDLEITRRS